jgi:hypothetical protein
MLGLGLGAYIRSASGLISFSASIFSKYRERVIAAGGVVENDACTIVFLNNIGEDTYNTASLIMYPSGYEAGTIFDLKPTDGSGDLTFTRASTATRVNAEGLIEGVRTNLLTYSEQFNNAAWAKTGCTVTANSSTDPIGGTTADKMVSISANTGSKRVEQTFSAVLGTTYTVSAYFKADGWNFAFFNAPEAQFTTRGDLFLNLTNGTLSGSTSLGSVESVGNGWYRLKYTRIATASGSTSFRFGFSDTASISSTGDGTNGVLIWGAQLETGDIATEYIPTTTTAVSVGMLANVPRIDYTGGGCGKLLLEPQRTNLFDYSEDFSQWAANAGGISSIEPNYAISPEGVENAYKVNFVVQGDSDLALVDGHSVTGGSTYAYSIYIKGEGSDIGKDIVVKSKRSSGDSAGTTTTQTLTGEWVRVDFITTYAANNTAANFYISSNDATSCLIYGAQAEAGSYATSYIPTTSTAVTRVADAAFKQNIAGTLPTAYPFTLFAECEVTPSSDGQALTFSNTASSTEYFTIDFLTGSNNFIK